MKTGIKSKLFGVAAMALSLAACAGHDLLSEKYATSMATDIVYEKTKENAPDALCSQPSFTTCLKENDFKCRYELGKLKQPCYEKSVAKMSKQLDMNGYEEFATYYFTCLMMSHSLQQLSGKESLACLSDLKLDDEELMSQIFK